MLTPFSQPRFPVCFLTRRLLPSENDYIAKPRIDFTEIGGPPELFRRDQGGAGAAKPVEHYVVFLRGILQHPIDECNRPYRWVTLIPLRTRALHHGRLKLRILEPLATDLRPLVPEADTKERQCRVAPLGVCATKAIAQQRLRGTRKIALKHERLMPTAELATTFREQARRWTSDLSAGCESSVNPSVVRNWKSYLDNWLLPVLGDIPLAEITHDLLKRLSELMTADGPAPNLIIECRGIARSVVASLTNLWGQRIYPHKWSFAGISEVSTILEEPDGLQTLFGEFNYRYFDGKLPTLPVSWSLRELGSGVLGCFQQDPDTRDRRILIATAIRRSQREVAIVLLHEMAHLHLNLSPDIDIVGDGHGPEFPCEKLRLMLAGVFEELL